MVVSLDELISGRGFGPGAHLRGDDDGPVPFIREEGDDVWENVAAVLYSQRAVLRKEVVLDIAAATARISRCRHLVALKSAGSGRAHTISRAVSDDEIIVDP